MISWIGGEHAIGAGRRAGSGDRSGRRAGRSPGSSTPTCTPPTPGWRSPGSICPAPGRWPSAWPRCGGTRAAHPDGVLWGHGWEETRLAGEPAADPRRGRRRGRQPARSTCPGSMCTPRWSVPRWPRACRTVAALAGWSDHRAGHPTGPRRGPSRCPATALGRQRTRRAAGVPATRRRPRGSSRCTSAARATRSGRADLAALLALDGPVRSAATSPSAVSDPDQARQLLAQTGAHALGGDLTVDGAIGSRTASLHRPLHRRRRTVAASGT